MAPSAVSANGHTNGTAPVTEPSKAHSKDTFSSGTLATESDSNRRHGGMGRTKDGRQLKVRHYPKFDSLEEERLYRKQHLAAAYRVFADRGFDEGVAGHISVRDPILTDHFWLNPLSKHFSQICVSDLILVDEEGQVVIGDEPINAVGHTSQHLSHRTSLLTSVVRLPSPSTARSTKRDRTSTPLATRTPSTARPSRSSAASWT